MALSVEIRGGGESSDGMQALVAIIAAHLSGFLAATAPQKADLPSAQATP